jgi:DNA-binding protein HU-beta
MNKSELVEALATHYDGSRADAAKALGAVVHAISAATAAGERVAITGFGVFERVERPARTVRNPRTGERLEAPATAVPRFRAGSELKAYVAGQRPVPELSVAAPGRRSAATSVASEPADQAPAPEPTKAPKPARTAKAEAKPTKITSSAKDHKARKGKKAKADKPGKADTSGKSGKSGKDKPKAKGKKG